MFTALSALQKIITVSGKSHTVTGSLLPTLALIEL